MLSTDGKGPVLCKSCETVLYQLSRAVVFLLFFLHCKRIDFLPIVWK